MVNNQKRNNMILLYEFDKPDIFSLPCENIWQDITFVIFNMIYKQWVPKRPQLVLNTHLTRVSYHTKQYQPMLCTIIYNTELHLATLYPTMLYLTTLYPNIPINTKQNYIPHYHILFKIIAHRTISYKTTLCRQYHVIQTMHYNSRTH